MKKFNFHSLSHVLIMNVLVAFLVNCGNQGPAFTEEISAVKGSANAEVSDTPIVVDPETKGDSEGIDQNVPDETVAAVVVQPDPPPPPAPEVVVPDVGTGGTEGGKATFYQCDKVNPDNRAIFVKAYDLASYEQAINDDFEANHLDNGDGTINFDNLKFIKDNFNASEALNTDRFLTSFCMLNYDVSPRSFSDGFPNSGHAGEVLPTFEWFALDTISDLEITEAGDYQLQIQSDDGAIVYLDGNNVLDNDGRHHPIKKQSGSLNLSKGKHRLVVHYFQGPRYQIALELYWKKPGGADFSIIPPDAFKFVQ